MATRKIKLPPYSAPSIDYFAPEILGELRDISDKLDVVIEELKKSGERQEKLLTTILESTYWSS